MRYAIEAKKHCSIIELRLELKTFTLIEVKTT
jgi:hypothetical protein